MNPIPNNIESSAVWWVWANGHIRLRMDVVVVRRRQQPNGYCLFAGKS